MLFSANFSCHFPPQGKLVKGKGLLEEARRHGITINHFSHLIIFI